MFVQMRLILSYLQSHQTAELEEENAPDREIEISYSRMKELLPFKAMEDLDIFFRPTDYQTSRNIDTFYGSLKVCPISDRLLKLFLEDNCTLQRICALYLPQSPTIINETDDLFTSRDLLTTLVLTNFYVFWFPMVHTEYIKQEGAAESLESVRVFLADLRVFECLFDLARETLGSHNILYATVLLDLTCLFLNTDTTSRSLETYLVGLSIMLDCLPGLSMTTALGLEKLAFTIFVHEYNTGNFELALLFAEKAVDTIKHLGNQCCVQYASATRVKGQLLSPPPSPPSSLHNTLIVNLRTD
ncbi:unnamed protein product [Rodentolepis nana]|uniref:Uncharacterized protein n=1 Tax=Rodentolepis nana TaxID=102285 RepID=A0A0R3U0Y7_RODNA|nr:unnamed protein product [Rodentolepis nana]